MSAFGQQLPVKEAFVATALRPKFGTPSVLHDESSPFGK